MALRLLTYVALLLEELAKDKAVQESGLLPPVLPIVLYNGTQPWMGAQDVAELFAPMPENLRPFNPKMSYLLFNEREVPPDALRESSIAAQLVRLEQAQSEKELDAAIKAVLDQILQWYQDNGFEVVPVSQLLLDGDTWLDEDGIQHQN